MVCKHHRGASHRPHQFIACFKDIHTILLPNKVIYLGKTVYSILLQSTQLQNGYLALIRQCLELVCYMLPTALEYPSGIEMVSLCTGLLGEEDCVNISVDTRL